MSVHVDNPDLQAKIDQWVLETGRTADELLLDAMAGYFDELAEVRTTIDRRFEEISSGKVQLIDGEEVRRQMKARTQALRDSHG